MKYSVLSNKILLFSAHLESPHFALHARNLFQQLESSRILQSLSTTLSTTAATESPILTSTDETFASTVEDGDDTEVSTKPSEESEFEEIVETIDDATIDPPEHPNLRLLTTFKSSTGLDSSSEASFLSTSIDDNDDDVQEEEDPVPLETITSSPTLEAETTTERIRPTRRVLFSSLTFPPTTASPSVVSSRGTPSTSSSLSSSSATTSLFLSKLSSSTVLPIRQVLDSSLEPVRISDSDNLPRVVSSHQTVDSSVEKQSPRQARILSDVQTVQVSKLVNRDGHILLINDQEDSSLRFK